MRTVRKQREDGAALVEFAFVAPLLILLILGTVEFSWGFAQNLSVRHAAREGARIAAVDFGDIDAIASEICGRTDFLSDLTLTLTGNDDLIDPDDEFNPGDEVTATVVAPLSTLTGLFDSWLPADLTSSVSIRIEQGDPSWAGSLDSPEKSPC